MKKALCLFTAAGLLGLLLAGCGGGSAGYVDVDGSRPYGGASDAASSEAVSSEAEG